MTAVTNLFDLSACTALSAIPTRAFYGTSVAGATFPASVRTFGEYAFAGLSRGATFTFLGDVPSFEAAYADHAPFYPAAANDPSTRHVFVADAASFPAWTNAATFVALADFGTNAIVSAAFGTGSPDYPGSRTLGVTLLGSGNGRYAWLVQYDPVPDAVYLMFE